MHSLWASLRNAFSAADRLACIDLEEARTDCVSQCWTRRTRVLSWVMSDSVRSVRVGWVSGVKLVLMIRPFGWVRSPKDRRVGVCGR